MNTQTLIIFVIFSFSNATFLGGPNPVTEIAKSAIEIPRINKMLAALSNFKNSISSTSQSKSFLRFVADTQEVSPTVQLLDLMEQVQIRIAEFNSFHHGFFDGGYTATAKFYIEDNIEMLSTDEMNRPLIDSLTVVVTSMEANMRSTHDLKRISSDIDVALNNVNNQYVSPDIWTDDMLEPFKQAVMHLDTLLLDTIEYATSLRDEQIYFTEWLIVAGIYLQAESFQQSLKRDADKASMGPHWNALIAGFDFYEQLAKKLPDLLDHQWQLIAEFDSSIQMIEQAMPSSLFELLHLDRIRELFIERIIPIREACDKVIKNF